MTIDKSICLSILLIMFNGWCFGQTQQGSKFVRGALNVNLNNIKTKVGSANDHIGSQNIFQLSSSAGYFLIDGVTIGASFDWERMAVTDANNEKVVNSSLAIGPFGRFYSALGPFFQGGFAVGGGSTKVKQDNGPNLEYPNSIAGWSLGIGFPYFLGEHISLEPLLLYKARNVKEKFDQEELFKYRGISLELGFVYYIF